MQISPTKSLSVALLIGGACAPPRPQVPSPVLPPPTTQADSQGTRAGRSWTLLPGIFRYSLVQNTTITLAGTDTGHGRITSRALIMVEVASEQDSRYRVSVAVDSVQLGMEGPVSPRLPMSPFSLGRILQGTFEPSGNAIHSELADSLCAYSQFVTAATDILLPQLPSEVGATLVRPSPDSLRVSSCRAGTKIEMVRIREITEAEPAESAFNLSATTQLLGAGQMGRDSVKVSGSITTRGKASFADGSRLPSSVYTSSDGLITVRLGDSTAVFRQVSSQEIHKHTAQAP